MPYSMTTTTIHSGATANGNGTAVEVGNYDHFICRVTPNGFTAQLNFEGSDDNSAWYGVPMQDATGTVTETGSIGQVFEPPNPHCYRYFRCRISNYSAGTVTAVVVRRRRGSG